jgi:predicted alpha/beta superfamily hydrolase
MGRVAKISLKNKALNRIPPTQYRRGRLLRLQIHSHWLFNSRLLDIYLPPGYDQEPQRRFPVLYMHDGNNLYDPALAFGGMPWHVDHMLDRLISHGLSEELIVVGIHNTPGRAHEYTWTQMESPFGLEGGLGYRYARFLADEVKPMIDHALRTRPEPVHTGVMGSSLGGLISFYLGLHFSRVFGKIGMVSPSFWWDHGHALRAATHFPAGLQLWLDMGTREGDARTAVNRNLNIINTRLMKRTLEQRGYREGENLGYLEDRGGRHNEWHWGQRLHLPLIFLFGKHRSLILRN